MRLSSSILLVLLAGCGTSQLPLDYAPSSAASRSGAAHGPAVVATVAAVDQRGETAADARWIGAIRGGFGNPLKRLETDRPLSEAVAAAVRDALRTRGLLGGAASPYQVQVTIEQLEADQMARREAKVRLRLAWVRADDPGGPPAFANQGQADIVNGSLVTLEAGVFGSVEDLRALTAQAMSQAVDQALDDPALASFLSLRR